VCGKPDVGVDDRILEKVGCEGVDRIYLAQHVVHWLSLVNMAMSL
jgi:hypothetical protein